MAEGGEDLGEEAVIKVVKLTSEELQVGGRHLLRLDPQPPQSSKRLSLKLKLTLQLRAGLEVLRALLAGEG